MGEFLLKHGIYTPELSSNILDLRVHIMVIKGLEKSYFNPTVQYENFTNSCKSLPPQIKEIWDVRVSGYHLSKLAGFIEKKFSKESAIGL